MPLPSLELIQKLTLPELIEQLRAGGVASFRKGDLEIQFAPYRIDAPAKPGQPGQPPAGEEEVHPADLVLAEPRLDVRPGAK